MGSVVVVGGSAGSHPALLRMVTELPADLPAAVLVVIHIGAEADSRLPQILRRKGRLPATHATDGAPLREAEILVAPPDFHLMVDDGKVRLSRGPRVNRVRPAVDLLFETAARSAGPLVTAVVLSGMLDDGAVGAAHVAEAGGQVLVEVPDEAPHGSMPKAALAAAPGALAVPAAELAAAVTRAVRRSAQLEREVHDLQRESAVTRMADSSDPGFLAGGETRLTRLACPECGGGMAEVSLPSISYFRCHVGHQFAPRTLAAAQAEAAEAKLWSAVAALDEHAVVLRHLAEHEPRGARARQRRAGDRRTRRHHRAYLGRDDVEPKDVRMKDLDLSKRTVVHVPLPAATSTGAAAA
ncbi:MAG TPA: chemotaxis protein CheB [Streptosporangiaceae bacterium]|nr:chemotaxis protein CheB [Streptosporangiaceae bacterium]